MLRRIWEIYLRHSATRIVCIIGAIACVGLYAAFGKDWVVGVVVFPLYLAYWQSNTDRRTRNTPMGNAVRFFTGLILIEAIALIIIYYGQAR